MEKLEFKDISTEKKRTYEFPCGSKVTIEEPKLLNVSASGGHRVLDAAGVSHYIPPKWIHLSWVSREGTPAFVL